MKKSLLILLVCITTLILSSCSNNDESKKYTLNSKELVTDILTENVEYCDCIINPNETLIDYIVGERPSLDSISIKKQLLKDLNFKSESDLEYSLILSDIFKLDEEMVNSSRIIQHEEWISILTNSSNDIEIGLLENRFKAVDSLCNLKVRFISKPIFNKEYTISAVRIDELLEFYNFANYYSIFEKKNGKWIPKQ